MARPPSTGFYSADISIGSSIVADRTSHFIKKAGDFEARTDQQGGHRIGAHLIGQSL
jgi:hypothetical protein